MSFVVPEATGCVRDFPRFSKECSASLPLVTDPWHCTPLREAAVPVLCLSGLSRDLRAPNCRRALNISHGGNLVPSVYTVMSALRKHPNTGTCLGLMALWKDFYIKKAVAKIAGFLIPVFLQACSSVCSELALEVGVIVHEVRYKHHMAACFSGKTIRDRVEKQHENILILNPAIHTRLSSHLLLYLHHKWLWIPRPHLGSLLPQRAWVCQNGKKEATQALWVLQSGTAGNKLFASILMGIHWDNPDGMYWLRIWGALGCLNDS